MKTILVTGGAGFIGSHFLKYMTCKYPKWQFVTVDSLVYSADKNLPDYIKTENHIFIKADITDADKLKEIFTLYDFDIVVNFAAQTHVDRSISNPDVFVHTNVYGTQCLLSAAKTAWQTSSSNNGYPLFKKNKLFIQISTDEVYGSIKNGEADENAPLLPSSPYAASKAAADLLVSSFVKTYLFPAVITRSSNNFGPRQYPEKLIPLMIKLALSDQKLPIYGDGLQKRDWIYVLDNVTAIEKVLFHGKAGEIYNVGSGTRRTNLEVVNLILDKLKKPRNLIEHVNDRLCHDFRYAVYTKKIKSLSWQIEHNFEKSLDKTIETYINSLSKG